MITNLRIVTMRRLLIVLAALPLLAIAPDRTRPLRGTMQEVLQFSTHGVTDWRNQIEASNLDRLGLLWRTNLPEGCDGAPIVVSNVQTKDGVIDLVIAETLTGRLAAINAVTGEAVWHTEPPQGPRWTTSSPAIDPNREYVYAYGLDGYVHKHRVTDGVEVKTGGFPQLITRKGDVEKGSSNISIATTDDGENYLYMTTSAYPEPGDDGDYQGHLVAINLQTGQQRLFNALCSDRPFHFDAGRGTRDCKDVMAGIWARPAGVYDSVTGRTFVTTGNGAYNADQGGFNWGSSVVALRPDARLDRGTPLDSYTPDDYQRLNDEDLDMSSTTITILPLARGSRLPHMGVQSGKDGVLRLLNLADLSGQGGPRHIGGELDLVALPQRGLVLTQPVAWLEPGTGKTWVFVVSNRGVAAFTLDPNQPKLLPAWTNTELQHGKTPVLIENMLFIVAAHSICAVDATTGVVKWRDDTLADTHWQSPAIVNSTIYVCDSGGYLSAYGVVR